MTCATGFCNAINVLILRREASPCENFIVRMQLEAVERFQQRESWERLTAADVEVLQSEVAGLPSEIETDDIESRLFDLTALKMQLALAEGDMGTLERQRPLPELDARVDRLEEDQVGHLGHVDAGIEHVHGERCAALCPSA